MSVRGAFFFAAAHMSVLAHRVILRQCNDSVAFGAKPTCCWRLLHPTGKRTAKNIGHNRACMAFVARPR
jgi:hypothetical protein